MLVSCNVGYLCTLTTLIVLTKCLQIITCVSVCLSEPNLAEPGLWHAARPPGHVSVLLRSEDLGWTGGTVPAPHRMEGQPGWPQIHGTAGQQLHARTLYLTRLQYIHNKGSLCGRECVQDAKGCIQ